MHGKRNSSLAGHSGSRITRFCCNLPVPQLGKDYAPPFCVKTLSPKGDHHERTSLPSVILVSVLLIPALPDSSQHRSGSGSRAALIDKIALDVMEQEPNLVTGNF